MPKKSPPHNNRPPHPALAQAVLAMQMRRPEEAAALAADVLKSDRGNALAAEILGRSLLALNRLEDAIVHMTKFARRADAPAIETLLGGLLAQVGRMDEALDQLRRTVARTPPYLPAFAELVLQLRKRGKLDYALAVAEQAVACEPQSADLLTTLGRVLMDRNERPRAREVLAKVHAEHPEHHDAIVALATVKTWDGDYAGAAELCRRALALKPQDDTRIRLAKYLLEAGERTEAESLLRATARGSQRHVASAVIAMVSASRGRIFLRPSATLDFLRAT